MKKYKCEYGGGPKPIITSNPKDPRLKAYRDSLALREQGINLYKKLATGKLETDAAKSLLTKPEMQQWLKNLDSNIIVNPNRINTKIKPTGFAPFDPNNPQYKVAMYSPVNQKVIYKPEDIPNRITESWEIATPADPIPPFKGTIDNISSDPSFPDPNNKYSAPSQGDTELYQDYVNRVHNEKMKYYKNKKKTMLYGGTDPIQPITRRPKYLVNPTNLDQPLDPSRVKDFKNVDQLAGTEPIDPTGTKFDVTAAAQGVGSAIGTIGEIGNMVASKISSGLDVANGVLGEIDSARLKREEQARVANELMKKPAFGTDQLNNIPVYTKFGGEPNANVEAEDGEIIQRTNGQIFEAEGDRHEQGGEDFANVERVLEDTAGKRKDPLSKALLIPKQEASQLIGKKVSKGLSHAEVFSKANEELTKKSIKYLDQIDKVEAEQNPDMYAINSTKLNAMFGSKLPKSEDLFNHLFDRQESIKASVGMQSDPSFAAYGKGPKPIKKYKPYDRPKQGNFSMKAGEMINYGDPSSYLNDNGLPVALTQEQQDQARAYQLSQTIPTVPITPPVFTEEQLGRANLTPKTEVPVGQSPVTYTKPPFSLTPSKESKLDNPLKWYDTVGPMYGLLNALQRDPELYNSVKFRPIKYGLQDVRPVLNNNQAEYNAAVSNLPNSSVGSAGAAQLFTNKLKADAQAIGANQNTNTQIQNQQAQANSEIQMKQELADAQSRGQYYDNVQIARAKQAQAKQDAINQLADNVGKHNAFNKTADLIMQLSPAFDQNARYNGKKYVPVNNSNELGTKSSPTVGTSLYKVTDKDGKITKEYLSDQEYLIRSKSNRYSSISKLK